MSFFAKFNKTGTTPITPQKFTVKTIKVASEPKSKPTELLPNRSVSAVRGDGESKRDNGRATPLHHPSSKRLTSSSRKRKHFEQSKGPSSSAPDLLRPPSPGSLASSRNRYRHSSSRSPLSLRLESSDESSSDGDNTDERATKRYKSVSPAAPTQSRNRNLVNPLSFRSISTSTNLENSSFVHADQIASIGNKTWGKNSTRVFKKSDNKLLDIKLQYPGISQSERYQLVQHTDTDEFNPVADILTTMEHVANHLLTDPQADEIFSETSGGLVYSLRRALKNGESAKFHEGVEKYNRLVRKYRKDGTFKTRIAEMGALPFSLVEHILAQTYARTVAPQVDTLKEYVAFSSTVYGELLPKFTTKLFKDADLTMDKVFVDLGSGTGNVVLHAALEIGCESWGCEIMPNAIALAQKQQKEFEARCKMWGVNPGKVRLERGDFLENRRIADILKRTDVLLVNNYVFDSSLNQRLLDMFLDLKEGAKVLSLKPFVPANHVITSRTAGNPVSRLRLEEKEYFSNSVSWTHAGGKYYIQTVDESMLRDFYEKEKSQTV
ncbi:DOT1-domain-containing protein [Morchella conica CCBAS932]|uniref:Histone-lysine N-methyltransferase, H3 lysine-79 specific n=1 Tax=Morchella conica CCBAS932 TaxID=1392247 RepID=A0A3N4KZJ9_9PEZI|nr:DOT1-domain-containing protein [Morchella conica CCBAS932]